MYGSLQVFPVEFVYRDLPSLLHLSHLQQSSNPRTVSLESRTALLTHPLQLDLRLLSSLLKLSKHSIDNDTTW
jgi:hypothetical protein